MEVNSDIRELYIHMAHACAIRLRLSPGKESEHVTKPYIISL